MKTDETTSGDSGKSHKMKINWANVILLAYFHIASFYSFYHPKLWSTHIIGVIFYMFGGLGGSMGAHRYYTHKAFKANLKLRVLLIFLQTISGQESAINWSRLHRIHHKFVDTDADPHNSKRGFFYSHIGWIMIERHPEVIAAGKKIDMSDLTNDPLLSFQNKFYKPLFLLINFLLPVVIMCYFGESMTTAWNVNVLRYLVTLHIVFCVNSIAHIWGEKPYDKDISPTNGYIVAFFNFGEGWHNYHHVFPWDYKTSELPMFYIFNFSCLAIEFFAWLGWATELKTVPDEIIQRKVLRSGDGSHKYSREAKTSEKEPAPTIAERFGETFWGFGDGEMNDEDKKLIKVL